MNVVIDSGEMALPLDVRDQVVPVSRGVVPLGPQSGGLVLTFRQRLGGLLVIPGVKAPQVVGQWFHLDIVDIEIERPDPGISIILDLDPGPV